MKKISSTIMTVLLKGLVARMTYRLSGADPSLRELAVMETIGETPVVNSGGICGRRSRKI